MTPMEPGLYRVMCTHTAHTTVIEALSPSQAIVMVATMWELPPTMLRAVPNHESGAMKSAEIATGHASVDLSRRSPEAQ